MSGERRKNRPNIERTLGSISFFSDLDAESLGQIAAVSRSGVWPEGTFLFHRDDEGDHMVALTAGRVRLSIGTPHGRELVICHLSPGDVVGELAVIDGRPRSADAFAIERSAGIVIDRSDFLRIARERADVPLAVARHLSELLRNTNYQMESIALYDLRLRVIRFFLFSIRQTHGDILPERALIPSGLNQAELSAVLGASRPKVNRVLQDLVAEGALTREGTQTYCNAQHLRRLAESDSHRDWP